MLESSRGEERSNAACDGQTINKFRPAGETAQARFTMLRSGLRMPQNAQEAAEHVRSAKQQSRGARPGYEPHYVITQPS